jgi:pimeloyl-ACP methyl ester carboxylesterase
MENVPSNCERDTFVSGTIDHHQTGTFGRLLPTQGCRVMPHDEPGMPTLVIHGDTDRILPVAACGINTHRAIKASRLVVIENGAARLLWIHADKVNKALLEFSLSCRIEDEASGSHICWDVVT